MGYKSFNNAMALSPEEIKSMYSEYLNPGLARVLRMLNFDKKFIRASGVNVWDSDGNEYLDFLGGYGALSLGHNPPRVVEAIRAVLDAGIPNLIQASMNGITASLGEALAAIAPGDLQHSFFCNSGTEAVEGALKTARIASGKTKIISTHGAFHGKTFGSLSASGREKYKKPFVPLLQGFEQVPYGDAGALEEKLKDRDVAAFIVEPIQGEGGVIVPPEGYLRDLRKLCSQYDVLLILDEIQTGLARTGRMFAVMWEDVIPDIMTVSKTLGGSLVPLGAFISTRSVWEKAYGSTETCMLHSSTFGGGAVACAVGLATINAIVEMDLPAQAEKKGIYLMNRLKEVGDRRGLLKEIRGKGLMIGMEFEQPSGWTAKLTGKLYHEYMTSLIAGMLMNEYRIITAYTLNNPTVIRVQPPLIVSYEQMNRFVDALDQLLAGHKNLPEFLMKSLKNMIFR